MKSLNWKVAQEQKVGDDWWLGVEFLVCLHYLEGRKRYIYDLVLKLQFGVLRIVIFQEQIFVNS